MKIDPDTLNEMALENRQQEREERALKNRILSMSNTERKAILWKEHFGYGVSVDNSLEWLEGGVY